MLWTALPAPVPAPNGPGSALRLDGVDDFVLVPDSPALRTTDRFTVEFWFHAATLDQGPNYLLAHNGINGGAQAAVIFGYSAPNEVEFYALGYTGDNPRPDSVITLPDTGWHHLAYSYDGTTWSGYRDGVQVFSHSPRIFSLNPSPNHWIVGNAFAVPGPDNVAGDFDEVRIWNVGRTADQIQADLRRQLFGNENGLVGYWHFDEGTGSTTVDATGNTAHTATLVNNPAWISSSLTPFAPTVITRNAAVEPAENATLNGAVFFNGADTTGFFQWGPSPGYGNTTPTQVLGNGSGSNHWSHPLTGLTAGVTYHYRAVATNSHGPSFGTDKTFRLSLTHTVMNANDSGAGSLRQAIQNAGAGDLIRFAQIVTGPIALTSGGILLDKDLTLQGPGASQFTISGGDASRVFSVAAGATVALSGLAITHGRVLATDTGACAEGGGVLNRGTLRMTNCVFALNFVRGGPGAEPFLSFPPGAGGCGQGGAVGNYGDLTLMGCTLTNNNAQGGAGGGGGSSVPRGALGGAARGGAIWSGPGRLAVFDSTVADNRATAGAGGPGTDVNGGHNDAAVGGFGGAASGGGLFMVNGTAEVRGCALVENETQGGQGGRGGNSGNGRGGPGGVGGTGSGGGLWAESSAASSLLVNCTVYANEAHEGRGGDGGIGFGSPNGATGVRGLGQGGGLHLSGGARPRVYLCTLTRNFASGRIGTVGGGGLEGRAECRSTIIAGNFASDAVIGAPDCAGDFTGSSFNLIGIGDGSSGFTTPVNQVGSLSFPLDPKLHLLGYYNGPTQVLPPRSDSPAVDRGHSSGTTNDQRRLTRPVDVTSIANAAGGDGADIGAVELGAVQPQAAGTIQFLNSSLNKLRYVESPGGLVFDAPLGVVVGVYWGRTRDRLYLVPNTTTISAVSGIFNVGTQYPLIGPGTADFPDARPGEIVFLKIAASWNQDCQKAPALIGDGPNTSGLTHYGESEVIQTLPLGPSDGPDGSGTVVWQGATGVNPNRAHPFIVMPIVREPTPPIVVNLNDDGIGSLRNAVRGARRGDVIQFDPSVRGRIVLSSGELFIDQPLTIQGPGAAQLTISGNNRSRIFRIGQCGVVDLRALTLTEGLTLGRSGSGPEVTGSPGLGGGIQNEGSLTLADCMITTNRAQGGRGGDGQIDGPLIVPGLGGFAMGGAIYNVGSLTLTRCSLLGNVAQGGRGGDGGVSEVPPLAGNGGIGGEGLGGAISTDVPVQMQNCTLAGNMALGGAGGYSAIVWEGLEGVAGLGGNGQGGAIYGPCVLESCTIVRNSAVGGSSVDPSRSGDARAGGVGAQDSIASTNRNSIIALNTVSGVSTSAPDVSDTGDPERWTSWVSEGGNLIGNADGSHGWIATDLVGSGPSPLDPLVGPVKNNGGEVWTAALLSGSPALDQGLDAVVQPDPGNATDARGLPRWSGAHVDIGAYEQQPPPLIVTTDSDSGAGSLRQAILQANESSEPKQIDLSGLGASRTIHLLSSLPPILRPVRIDGGVSFAGGGGAGLAPAAAGPFPFPGTVLDGANAGAGTHGLVVRSSNVVVRGLILHSFGGHGILLSNASRCLLDGNFIGTDATGTTRLANGSDGIHLEFAPSNTITASVIAGNRGHGVLMIESPGNEIRQCRIGSGPGTPAVPLNNSGHGVFVAASPFVRITDGNVIGPNSGHGVYLYAATTRDGLVFKNYLGVDRDGSTPLGNGAAGVGIFDASNNQIGGPDGAANWIAHNTAGVTISGPRATNNAIRFNSIFSNLGPGIDLDDNGITANDAGDADSGPNGLQNFPVLTQGAPLPGLPGALGALEVRGVLDSRPNTTYLLDFYANASCDASGNGQGLGYLGSTNFTTDASGHLVFIAITTDPTGLAATALTATATDPAGNTSEFSPCAQVMFNAFTPPPNGPGSALRLDGVDDFVRIEHSPMLTISNRFTLEFWFRPASFSQEANYLLAHNGLDAGGQAAVILGYSAPNEVEFYALGYSGANPRPNSVIALPDLGWHHLAYSYDGTNWASYRDGVQITNVTRTFSLSTVPNDWLVGAAFPVAGTDNVAGDFDEVRIWNVGRTAAQIREARCRQLFGDEPGLVACYRFDEGTGLVAADATGYPDHTAALVNGPVWVESNLLSWAPTVSGGLESMPTPTSATLVGTGIANNSPAKMFFQWGLTPSYGNVTAPVDFGDGTIPGFWRATLTGLIPGATYHARAVGTNGCGASYGADFTFIVPGPVTLSIRFGSPNNGANTIILNWPNPSPGYVLQQSANMSGPGGGWVNVTEAPVIVGPNKEVTLQATGQFCLFRLGSAGIAPGENCAAATALAPNSMLLGQTTTGFQNDFTATTSCVGALCPGPDRFYQITVPAGQRLTVVVTPLSEWDPAVYLLSECAAPVCLAGADSGGTGAEEIVTYLNTTGAARVVMLGVDSFATGNSGGFIIDNTVAP